MGFETRFALSALILVSRCDFRSSREPLIADPDSVHYCGRTNSCTSPYRWCENTTTYRFLSIQYSSGQVLQNMSCEVACCYPSSLFHFFVKPYTIKKGGPASWMSTKRNQSKLWRPCWDAPLNLNETGDVNLIDECLTPLHRKLGINLRVRFGKEFPLFFGGSTSICRGATQRGLGGKTYTKPTRPGLDLHWKRLNPWSNKSASHPITSGSGAIAWPANHGKRTQWTGLPLGIKVGNPLFASCCEKSTEHPPYPFCDEARYDVV